MMKKIILVFFLTSALMWAGNINAQTKIAYISMETMLRLMPETAKIDSILEQYQKDSINPQYGELVTVYQYKDSVYRDSLRTPAPVRKQVEQELQSLIYQIQNWQTIVNQAMQAKESELLAPIYNKVYDAVKQVAKEKGYTHVFNKEALLIAPDGDDIITLVAGKLKVPLPKTGK